MGFGDVKLMAMVGAFLGMKLTMFTLFSASIAGSIFGVSTVFMVWIKRTRRRMQRQHESGREARRRAWESAAIALRHHQMPFGVFLGGHGDDCFLFWEPVLAVVLGADCEASHQSHSAAHGAGFLCLFLCLCDGQTYDAANPPIAGGNADANAGIWKSQSAFRWKRTMP